MFALPAKEKVPVPSPFSVRVKMGSSTGKGPWVRNIGGVCRRRGLTVRVVEQPDQPSRGPRSLTPQSVLCARVKKELTRATHGAVGTLTPNVPVALVMHVLVLARFPPCPYIHDRRGGVTLSVSGNLDQRATRGNTASPFFCFCPVTCFFRRLRSLLSTSVTCSLCVHRRVA